MFCWFDAYALKGYRIYDLFAFIEVVYLNSEGWDRIFPVDVGDGGLSNAYADHFQSFNKVWIVSFASGVVVVRPHLPVVRFFNVAVPFHDGVVPGVPYRPKAYSSRFKDVFFWFWSFVAAAFIEADHNAHAFVVRTAQGGDDAVGDGVKGVGGVGDFHLVTVTLKTPEAGSSAPTNAAILYRTVTVFEALTQAENEPVVV